jgi:hypothetical protein
MKLILHRGFVQKLVFPYAVGLSMRDLLSPNGQYRGRVGVR